jgi:putative ABC transport system substrate-binding protein
MFPRHRRLTSRRASEVAIRQSDSGSKDVSAAEMIFATASTAAVLRFVVVAIVTIMAAINLPNPAAAQAAKQSEGERVYRIGFHLWKPGRIYDEALSGIEDGLKIAGIAYESVVVTSNQDESLAMENITALDASKLDVVFSLSSAGTQIIKKIGMHTPVIATVINHPVSLNISEDRNGSKVKLSGTSYYIDVKDQLRLYQQLFSGTRKIGMIYDVNNPAGYLAEEPFLRQACAELGLGFLSVGVDEVADLPEAVQHLLDAGTDLVVIPTNNLVYDNLTSVLPLTNRKRVPVVSMSKQGVENGALAALYADTYDLGRQAAELAVSILRGDVDAQEAGFQYARHPDIIINLTTAKALQYQFPADVLGKAAIVVR